MRFVSLKLNNISCVRRQKKVLADLSLELVAGDILLIEGENGAGKSSLLRLIAGLAVPFTGNITWQNQAIENYRAQYHNNIFYLGHTNAIKLNLTVKENLYLGSQLHFFSLNEVDNLLEALQLSAEVNTLTQALSAGQKRRVALAKLFLSQKKIWLLDEPFTALDQHIQQFCQKQFENHANHGGIILISTHHRMSFNYQPIKLLRLNAC